VEIEFWRPLPIAVVDSVLCRPVACCSSGYPGVRWSTRLCDQPVRRGFEPDRHPPGSGPSPITARVSCTWLALCNRNLHGLAEKNSRALLVPVQGGRSREADGPGRFNRGSEVPWLARITVCVRERFHRGVLTVGLQLHPDRFNRLATSRPEDSVGHFLMERLLRFAPAVHHYSFKRLEPSTRGTGLVEFSLHRKVGIYPGKKGRRQ